MAKTKVPLSNIDKVEDAIQTTEPFIPQYILCADLSLRQPGFAVLELAENGRIRVIKTAACHNKKYNGTHGNMLVRIAKTMRDIVKEIPAGSKVVFVRERAFSRFNRETQTLNKVVGLSDYMLANSFLKNYEVRPKDWQEVAPSQIKAIVTGSGRATKADVQNYLPDFVGQMSYGTDDESDAVAVGVAYLVMNNLGRPLHLRK